MQEQGAHAAPDAGYRPSRRRTSGVRSTQQGFGAHHGATRQHDAAALAGSAWSSVLTSCRSPRRDAVRRRALRRWRRA